MGNRGMEYILAIDQSTSATKALIYRIDGKLIDKVALEHRQIYPQPGWVEHDAEEIWRNTCRAVGQVVARNAEVTDELICLSITNQRETIVAFDRETGEPLGNAIVWQCRRGDPLCADLVDRGHEDEVRRLTGLKIDTYFSASKLKWLVDNRPDIAEKLKKGEGAIGTIDAYLIYRLTNGEVFATDHTNASRTLLYDIGKLQWDEGLCALFSVPVKGLPQVRESSAHFGETDVGGILGKRLPICGVMGDSQASLFAQRCFEPGMIKVTFGTGSSVLLNIGPELRYSDSGAVSTIAWVHGGKTTYSFEGLINYSAATIAWLRDQLGLFDDERETDGLATSVDDNGGVYLVPAFAGLSAPYWSQTARAAIVGMSAHSSRAHVVRAGLESIAYQLRDVLEMMRNDAGVELDAIHADGGATANRFLMQFTADMVGLELKVADIAECSPLGAVMVGALGMKRYGSLEELGHSAWGSAAYRPERDENAVNRLYEEWKQAVKRVL
jgi:glycerol kinase